VRADDVVLIGDHLTPPPGGNSPFDDVTPSLSGRSPELSPPVGLDDGADAAGAQAQLERKPAEANTANS
jgi:hypothetical protein